MIAFKREAVIHDVMGLSRRPHPNLCHMIDALVAPDGYFTVFPFVEGAWTCVLVRHLWFRVSHVWVAGMLLDKYIQRKPGGRLSPEEAKWLFTQLLSGFVCFARTARPSSHLNTVGFTGLKRIHDIGVVHLDLKAENIFVSPAPVQTSPVVEEAAVAPYQEAALLERTDNHLVLIDFGVSSPFPNPWKKRFVISRLREYMPPEVCPLCCCNICV